MSDPTRTSSASAGGSVLCLTLNYHLSTLNILSTTASDWLERLVRRALTTIMTPSVYIIAA